MCLFSSALLIVVLLLPTEQCASSPLCTISNDVDYSQRSLSIVSFDNRGPGFNEKRMRGFGQRLGPGVRDIVVLGKNCSWKPLEVRAKMMASTIILLALHHFLYGNFYFLIVYFVHMCTLPIRNTYSFSINRCTTRCG